jgi:stearoyl-CoA desaturase (delta-9 desaturase)
MNTLILCLAVFLIGYLTNILYITVFYHRGLTHRALTLHPKVVKWVALTGPWVTGLDPKGWICMHRMHHLYSDTERDPHSPKFQGVFGLALGQLKSYERVLVGLIKKNPTYTEVVKDLPFDVNILNKKKLWIVPYLSHLTLSLVIAFALHQPWVAFAYYMGIMSHPIQGWMVNALAHSYGYRNFETPDNSKNNSIVAWLVFGEGYQNNHHQYPESALFAMKTGEVDLGYALCWVLEKAGLLTIPSNPQLQHQPTLQ